MTTTHQPGTSAVVVSSPRMGRQVRLVTSSSVVTGLVVRAARGRSGSAGPEGGRRGPQAGVRPISRAAALVCRWERVAVSGYSFGWARPGCLAEDGGAGGHSGMADRSVADAAGLGPGG